ncbi:hypothetical protein [Nocardia sp. CA-120079]|uniref:hypothetical protein n=1 Tax=Nocardia sp. CA-120079 TaxID=3239974 RepID=UPI003D956355
MPRRREVTEDDTCALTGDRAVEPHLEGMRVKKELMLNAAGLEGISLRYGLFYGAAKAELGWQPRYPSCADNLRALAADQQV